MQVGIIGLGKMGAGMAQRLLARRHAVVGFDLLPDLQTELEGVGLRWASSLPDLVAQLAAPRSVWLMLPPGAPTADTITALVSLLAPGDTVIDGGNSHYRDAQRQAQLLATGGVQFLDVGTNSGVAGATDGYCLTVGGDADVVERHRPLFEALAPAPHLGWGHVGTAGAGHFAKMVHNAISYGLMQAYAEGLALLAAKRELDLSPRQLAEIWRHGSLIESWLLDLTAAALTSDEALADIRGWVPDTGEGRWAVAEAIDLDLSIPVITAALLRRLRSRETDPYSDRLLAALRRAFGGHEVLRIGGEGLS